MQMNKKTDFNLKRIPRAPAFGHVWLKSTEWIADIRAVLALKSVSFWVDFGENPSNIRAICRQKNSPSHLR